MKAIHPGEFVADELVERGWTRYKLAKMVQTEPRYIQELIECRRSVDEDLARGLGRAFGTGPVVWTRLQAAYDRAQ